MFVSAVSPTLRTVLFSAKFDSAQYYPHGFLPSTLLASNHKGIQIIQKFLFISNPKHFSNYKSKHFLITNLKALNPYQPKPKIGQPGLTMKTRFSSKRKSKRNKNRGNKRKPKQTKKKFIDFYESRTRRKKNKKGDIRQEG